MSGTAEILPSGGLRVHKAQRHDTLSTSGSERVAITLPPRHPGARAPAAPGADGGPAPPHTQHVHKGNKQRAAADLGDSGWMSYKVLYTAKPRPECTGGRRLHSRQKLLAPGVEGGNRGVLPGLLGTPGPRAPPPDPLLRRRAHTDIGYGQNLRLTDSGISNHVLSRETPDIIPISNVIEFRTYNKQSYGLTRSQSMRHSKPCEEAHRSARDLAPLQPPDTPRGRHELKDDISSPRLTHTDKLESMSPKLYYAHRNSMQLSRPVISKELPSRSGAHGEKKKRRRVGFRTDSPEVLERKGRDPYASVALMGEPREKTRSGTSLMAMDSVSINSRPSSKPKSILKKRRSSQVNMSSLPSLEPDSDSRSDCGDEDIETVKLPSLSPVRSVTHQHPTLRRSRSLRTRSPPSLGLTFNCSNDFAKAFENLSHEDERPPF